MALQSQARRGQSHGVDRACKRLSIGQIAETDIHRDAYHVTSEAQSCYKNPVSCGVFYCAKGWKSGEIFDE